MIKHDVMSFRSLIDEMKAVAKGQSMMPARTSKRLYVSENARAEAYRVVRTGGLITSADNHATKSAAPRLLGELASIGAMTRLFTPENQRMVSLIAQGGMRSVADLAKRTDRAESNVSRTLSKFVALGLVAMDPGEGRAKIPRLLVRSLQCELDLASGHVQVLSVARTSGSKASRPGRSVQGATRAKVRIAP